MKSKTAVKIDTHTAKSDMKVRTMKVRRKNKTNKKKKQYLMKSKSESKSEGKQVKGTVK